MSKPYGVRARLGSLKRALALRLSQWRWHRFDGEQSSAALPAGKRARQADGYSSGLANELSSPSGVP
jgi:hypothetical protein